MTSISEILALKKASSFSSSSSHNTEMQGKGKEKKEQFSLSIILDEDQQSAVQLAKAGKSFCLIGKAGTGKTTSEREIVKAILQNCTSSHVFRIQGMGQSADGPGIAVLAYTRIAAGNSKKAIFKEAYLEEVMPFNITTIHNFLEFQPEFYYDEATEKDKMRFVPKRGPFNPVTTTTIIIEEASMVDMVLAQKLYLAIAGKTQLIFIGDINQLPPPFGISIFNHALRQLPIVELKTVYRQEEGSIILENAHNILEGRKIKEDKDFKIIRLGDVQHGQEITSFKIAKAFKLLFEKGEYDPEQDIILTPLNVQPLGSDNMNSHIAQMLGSQRNALIHHIIAGIRQLYLAVGDSVRVQKIQGVIKNIKRNPKYWGRVPKHSIGLDRFGHHHTALTSLEEEESEQEIAEFSLENDVEAEDLTHQASHVVTVELETGEIVELSKTGELSAANFSLGYCLTFYKSQGCEWRNVFIIMHKDQSIQIFNEALYTAVTRAKQKVMIFAKDWLIDKAIATRRIKGSSLKDKLEWFNEKLSNEDEFTVSPW